jgi:hypothetical protein
MIYLYTTYFIHSSESRQKEIDECIVDNIKNKYFHKIIIFADLQAKEKLLSLLTAYEKNKISIVINADKPTYKQWIETIHNIDHIAIFCNTDIYFDDSIFKIYEYFQDEKRNSFICISRHEIVGEHSVLHNNPYWSQDVWVIRQRDKKNINFLQHTDISVGIPRCDNKIAYIFATHNWCLYNPCYYIKCYHKHESNIRLYNKTDQQILGGLIYVYPNILNNPSTLKLDYVYINCYNNILDCNLNNYLIEHLKE